MKTWFTKVGVEEVEWLVQSTDLHSTEHLWDELHARPSHPTSVLDLTNALAAEWKYTYEYDGQLSTYICQYSVTTFISITE